MSNEKQLNLLEQELILLQDNIERLRQFKIDCKDDKWKPSHSHVVGELKHRAVALKQKLTLVSSINTYDFLRE